MSEARPPLRTLVEALLFASPDPMGIERMAAILEPEGADHESVASAVNELRELFEKEGRAFRLERCSGGWHLVTDPSYAPVISRLNPPKQVRSLTGAAIETLAVIAYNQPITRARLDSIRGVNSEGALRNLLDRALIRPAGRAEEPGRPQLYVTTEGFLKQFGLDSLEDLPRDGDFPSTSLKGVPQ